MHACGRVSATDQPVLVLKYCSPLLRHVRQLRRAPPTNKWRMFTGCLWQGSIRGALLPIDLRHPRRSQGGAVWRRSCSNHLIDWIEAPHLWISLPIKRRVLSPFINVHLANKDNAGLPNNGYSLSVAAGFICSFARVFAAAFCWLAEILTLASSTASALTDSSGTAMEGGGM